MSRVRLVLVNFMNFSFVRTVLLVLKRKRCSQIRLVCVYKRLSVL